MFTHKSQKVAENNKKIQMIIDILSNNKDLFIIEIIKIYEINHIILNRRFKREKSITKSRKQ